MSHKFHVGESVILRLAMSGNVPGGVFQYRIKSANEEHERVAREGELTKA
jgi:hypothetical protein